MQHALRRLRLDGGAVTPIRDGEVNEHWLVETDTAAWVLRRYTRRRPLAAITYEHRVLDHLGGAGWPVAPARPLEDATSVAQVDGRCYALFPRLPGSPADDTWQGGWRSWGAMLARLHRATMPLLRLGPRPSFTPLYQTGHPAAAASPPASPPNRAGTGARHLARGRAAAAAAERTLVADELRRLGAWSLPKTVVHGDFFPGNLLVSGGQVTGVLDFDFAHPDVRAADLAVTSAYLSDPADLAELVRGYRTHILLQEPELAALPALRAARLVQHLDFCLALLAGGGDILDEIDQTLDRLAAERRHRGELAAMLRSLPPDTVSG